ncbi:hypothetical protein ACSBOB_01700 [Mesorhizobium sp. ASY16-5R]|uniref:hypothetical protein n=1 Tax=Mesorhizobium sp. ASY16-5R TaxID=3445772 RepID=UPI003F9EBBAB
MARIRSTHPGQWSDEDFVALSYPARLLALAVRNIADDRGIFEWKPLTMKMQLMPADNVDIGDLLSELVGNNIVIKFEAGGKQYGAIRNFMRWQRPKKPSYQYPVTEPVLSYVGVTGSQSGNDDASTDDSSKPVPNRFPTGTEIAAQRKEEGSSKQEQDGFANAQPSSRRRSKNPEPEPQPAKPKTAPPGEAGSAEDRFWALSGDMESKGVGRTVMGKLAKLYAGDFASAIGALEDAARAKVPRSYLGKIISNLERDAAPPTRNGVPTWVIDARTQGYPVEPEDGRWRFCGGLYDDQKQQVGM